MYDSSPAQASTTHLIREEIRISSLSQAALARLYNVIYNFIYNVTR